ncbi:Swt21 protein [Saccharomycopsis crataegensis]|uniref:Swt21 protein n=1 Tax=Saccharomycopsis crataegensis TaxID=43959 RepID=A0AAV5QF77_9ASCO|nr:Swt21 protein [Saccharomycopsis crataegensis]
MNYTVRASTGDVFTLSSFSDVWRRESYYHERLRLQSQDYQYPKLRSPIFDDRDQCASSETHDIVKDLTWSKDGSTLVSVCEDFGVRMYVMPTDLCDGEHEEQENKIDAKLLNPLNRIFMNNSIISHSVNPGFDLYGEESYLYNFNNILISERQLPIKLVSLIPTEDNDSPVISHYQFRDIQNDRYFDSYSLKFISGNNFVAGSTNYLGVFNVDHFEPLATFKLTNFLSLKNFGITSCIEPFKEPGSNCVYMGSYLNQFAAIDLDSQSTIVTKALTPKEHGIGNGIYQIIESDNHNFVYLLSRKTNTIPILDRRMGYEMVDQLQDWHGGAAAIDLTSQKCFGDLLGKNQGLLVGNQRNEVKVWKDCAIGIGGKPDLYLNVGNDLCSLNTSEHHFGDEPCDDVKSEATAIGSVRVNPNGDDNYNKKNIVAIAQGSRPPPSSSSSNVVVNGIKVYG